MRQQEKLLTILEEAKLSDEKINEILNLYADKETERMAEKVEEETKFFDMLNDMEVEENPKERTKKMAKIISYKIEKDIYDV